MDPQYLNRSTLALQPACTLKHAITSILAPQSIKWVCRESLCSIVAPGHLLSPDLFLKYRRVVESIRYNQNIMDVQRHEISLLWDNARTIRWGPLHIPLFSLLLTKFIPRIPLFKHLIRNSYRRLLLKNASKRRKECTGLARNIDIAVTRSFYFA